MAPPTTHPPLYGLGGTYLEGDAAVLRDRQQAAVKAATERVRQFRSMGSHYEYRADSRVLTIAAIETYLRVMRESETEE
jgi:hypothetical protein